MELELTEDGLAEIARVATLANSRTENIGARRLATVFERLLDEVSFAAPERAGQKVVVDGEYVRRALGALLDSEDLSRYIL